MDPIFRVSLLVTLVSMIHPHLTDDSVQAESKEYVMKQFFMEMVPLMKVLGLDESNMGNMTQEEFEREIMVDFSTLPALPPTDEKMGAKVALNFRFHGLQQAANIRKAVETLHSSDHAKYDLKKFNTGIVALGIDNFMKAATQFCAEEAAGGAYDIVSIGSGDGTVEKAIMTEYRSRYGKDLPRIKLVDPDPAFDGTVDYKTVNRLIEGEPNMVGNCVAFMIWPLPANSKFQAADDPEPYDIEAVRKLQPRAVFVLYECLGASGSKDLRVFLRDKKLLMTLSPDEIGFMNWFAKFDDILYVDKTYGLDNYKVIEIAHQKLWRRWSGTYFFRIVKMKRAGSKHDSSDL